MDSTPLTKTDVQNICQKEIKQHNKSYCFDEDVKKVINNSAFIDALLKDPRFVNKINTIVEQRVNEALSGIESNLCTKIRDAIDHLEIRIDGLDGEISRISS